MASHTCGRGGYAAAAVSKAEGGGGVNWNFVVQWIYSNNYSNFNMICSFFSRCLGLSPPSCSVWRRTSCCCLSVRTTPPPITRSSICWGSPRVTARPHRAQNTIQRAFRNQSIENNTNIETKFRATHCVNDSCPKIMCSLLEIRYHVPVEHSLILHTCHLYR